MWTLPSRSQHLDHWSWQKWKWTSWKIILSTPLTLIPLEWIPYPTIGNSTTIHEEKRTLRNKQGKQSKFVGIVGRKYHLQVAGNPAMPSLIIVAKKDILETLSSLLIHRWKKHDNITKHWNEYPSTMVTIEINGQQHTKKVDSSFQKIHTKSSLSNKSCNQVKQNSNLIVRHCCHSWGNSQQPSASTGSKSKPSYTLLKTIKKSHWWAGTQHLTSPY